MYKRVRVIVLYALLFVGVVHKQAIGQETAPGYAMEKWTNEDGLPVDFIRGVIQSTDGYIWLTTQEGLTRFDGYSFKTFNSSNTPALIHSKATELTASFNGEFWFNNGSRDSLRIIQYKQGVFTHYPFNYKPISLLSTITDNRRIEQTDEGVLWVAGEDGLFKFSEGEFVQVFKNEIQSGILSIQVKGSKIWVATLDGFYCIDDDLISFFEYNNDRGSNFLIEENETIWIATKTHLTRLTNNETTIFPLPEELVNKFIVPRLEQSRQSSDVLFLSIRNSRFIFRNQEFVELFNYLKAPFDVDPEIHSDLRGAENSGWFILNNGIYYEHTQVATLDIDFLLRYALFVDKHQQAWVATKQGLYKFKKPLFSTYGSNSSVKNIYPLFEDHEGAIWTSTLRGSVFKITDEKFEQIKDAIFPRVFSFYEGPDKNIWFGTGLGIEVWNRRSNSISPLPTPFDRGSVQVRVLQENNRGNIWAGSKAGLYEYMMDTQEWRTIPVENDLELRIEQLFQRENGRTWIGTYNNGLYTINNDHLIAFKDNDQLSDVSIRSIYMDAEGILWVGLNGGGLNRIELNEDGISAKSVTRYSRENGLFGLVIHSILEDEHGRIWMSSNQGIFWVYKDQLTNVAQGEETQIYSTAYQREDGLPGNEANGGAQNAGLVAKDGTFWFAMLDGLASIHPSQVPGSPLSFPPIIETIEADDTLWASFDEEIRVPKESRNITITYTAPHYTTKHNDLRFSYQLEGLSDDWVLVDSDRSVSFVNLSAGSYTFNLKAGTNNQWDEEQTRSVRFVVEPYFYERTSFYVLLALLGSGFLCGLILFRRKLQTKVVEPSISEIDVAEEAETAEHHDPFLLTISNYIEDQIEKPSITVSELAELMNMGERNLRRKIKASTGFSPNQFIREIRLTKAREILESRRVTTISEVAHSVGFSTPFYFSKLFEERFNIHPKDVIK